DRLIIRLKSDNADQACDCSQFPGGNRHPKNKPGRRERNFWMRRQGAKNRHSNARTLTETRTRELSGQKSAQKRPIWRRIGNVRFAETGWWCAQSYANRSQPTNPCYSLLFAFFQG